MNRQLNRYQNDAALDSRRMECLTAIDKRHIEHSEVCVEAASLSILVVLDASLRRFWWVVVLSIRGLR